MSRIRLNIFKIKTRTAFFLSFIMLIAVFSLYVYLVNRTVMNVVARQRMEKEMVSISGTIGDLEFKYITLKNSVTLELAYQKGFQDASPSSFLAREKHNPALSYNYSD